MPRLPKLPRLPSLRRFRAQAPGTAPGTLTAPAERRVDEVSIRLFDYGPERLEERTVASAEELVGLRRRDSVTWVDVVGLHDVETVRRVGELFGLHPLALEDVLNTGHRPKTEPFPDHHFVLTKSVRLGTGLESEQVSIFFGHGFVVTFQETAADPFDGVRERLRTGRRKIRSSDADYLAYALLDAMVDELFPVLEGLGERLEALEEEVIERPDSGSLQEIHRLRRELLVLRRATWPQREVVQVLERDESGLIAADTRPFLRDCYDHVIQVLDFIETYRELASGLLDIYLSGVSNRMNEVMKVLTVIATLFIPLTFIAGIYGMNFDPAVSAWNMPELGWRYGYPASLALMAAVAVVLLLYFRRKGWF